MQEEASTRKPEKANCSVADGLDGKVDSGNLTALRQQATRTKRKEITAKSQALRGNRGRDMKEEESGQQR